jgi:hypothetical protein
VVELPRALDGWLMVFGIGLFFALAYLSVVLLGYVDLLDAAGWSPSALLKGFDDDWMFRIYLGTSTTTFLWLIVLVVLFFRRSRWFPGAMIGLLLCWLVLEAAEVALAQVPMQAPNAVRFALGMPVAALGTSYLRRSRRVKATFVN